MCTSPVRLQEFLSLSFQNLVFRMRSIPNLEESWGKKKSGQEEVKWPLEKTLLNMVISNSEV